MMPQKEIQYRQVTAGVRARRDQLHETRAGGLRQSGRIEQLPGRIAEYRRIEMRIAGPACVRGGRDLVGDANNAEPAEPPAVIGIDSHHQDQDQQGAEPERGEADHEAATERQIRI